MACARSVLSRDRAIHGGVLGCSPSAIPRWSSSSRATTASDAQRGRTPGYRAIWKGSVMTGQETADRNRGRLSPPAPKDFDPLAATEEDLKRHGLPLRPDPRTQPGMAALWERKARRYRNFEHLEPQFEPAAATTPVTAAASPAGTFELSPYESCGYELDSFSAPFTALFVTWTVPDLKYTPSPLFGPDPNLFRTFVTL